MFLLLAKSEWHVTYLLRLILTTFTFFLQEATFLIYKCSPGGFHLRKQGSHENNSSTQMILLFFIISLSESITDIYQATQGKGI